MSTSSGAVPADLKDRLKATYNAIAPTYNAWNQKHTARRLGDLRPLLDIFPSDAPPASLSILELGCGAGQPVTEALVADARVGRVYANDLSSAQIALAKRNLGLAAQDDDRVVWLEGDMTLLKFEPGSLDAVVAFFSIIHLPREEQGVMLAKIASWLKPGGYLLANFEARAAEANVVEKWFGHEEGWTFSSGWGTEGTLERVKQIGLEIVSGEVKGDVVDVKFLWVLARRPVT